MHFTREPIIETIISPKEGCKLLLRNSRGEQTEEHYVDAVEVVSFGKAFFFRSIEKPKAFLLPVSDYEILEVKEPRLTLKTAPLERQNIKIGGGKEVRPKVEIQEEEEEASSEEPSVEAQAEPTAQSDRRRDRRRRRHRRSSEHAEWTPRKPESSGNVPEGAEAPVSQEEPPKMPSLIPPPTTLISETLSRYKPKEATETVEEKKETGGDAAVQRVVTTEDPMLSSTYFLPVESDRDFYSF
ncbi:MAG: hypothetical protein RLZZ453_1093 [Chlamydiota bacterium]